MNYELILIQVIIGALIGLTIVKLFQTNKSISYEKRISKFALDPNNDYEFSFFDQIYLFLYGLIKSISKYLSRFKFLKKKTEKYNKYISYNQSNQYLPIDFMAIKYLIVIFVTVINIIMALISIKSIDYIPTIIIAIVCYYALDLGLIIIFKKKKQKIENDLLRAIMIMNNTFLSGSNIMKAIETVVSELDGPIQDEFKKILKDLKFGLDIDTAFSRFYNRINLPDAKYIALSLSLLNKTGGSIISIFNSIERSIMSRNELKKELKTITAASKLTYRILVSIPIMIVISILFINPSFFNPFIASPIGIIISLIVLILFLSYIIFIKKILKVDNI